MNIECSIQNHDKDTKDTNFSTLSSYVIAFIAMKVMRQLIHFILYYSI
jgi:hypothetical protein